jgi:hypothetical protein
LLFLTALLASQPLTVSAHFIPTPEEKALNDVVDAGDAYIDHVGGAMLYAASSVKRIDAIKAGSVKTLSEGALEQAREDLWDLALSLSLAIGDSTQLSQSVSLLGLESIDALDVEAEAQAGLPEETRTDLVTKAGLSSAQADAIEAELAERAEQRFALAIGGLPTEHVAQLSDAGFSAGEIGEVESALRSWGLVDSSLNTTQKQFEASRDEFAAGRSQALVAYVQLLGKQILIRQANGVEPRSVTQEELESLAQDELRLLIHAVHLQELWGDDARLEVGEGDWWFIERYATRAAERLERIILDSQNRGLVAELLFVLHFASLAETARAGDAQYVKNELDGLIDLLTYETDALAFVSDQRVQTRGVTKLAARVVSSDPLREHIAWSLNHTAIDLHAKSIQDRLEKSVELPPFDQVGAVAELDETNNTQTYLFAAGLEFWAQLEVDILLVALDILEFINDGSLLAWIKAILTGDTETPAQFTVSVLFGLIPVLGSIQDIYTLVTESGIFMKALAIVGIIGGLGELLALIGLEPVAGAAFLGNAASKVMKGLFRLADEIAQFVLNSLKLRQAFDVILEFLEVAFKGVSHMGGSLDEVIDFVRKLLTGDFKLWDNFIAFVRRVGADTLVKMGFDEGSMIVGGIIRRGGDLADDALRTVDNVADDLVHIGADFSDEAFDGLGEIADDVEEDSVRGLIEGVGCLLSGVALAPGSGVLAVRIPNNFMGNQRFSSSACNLAGETIEAMTKAGIEWSDEAFNGVKKVVNLFGEGGPEKVRKLIEAIDDPIVAERTFVVLQKMSIKWSDEAIYGVSRLLNITPDLDLDRVFRVINKTGGAETGEAMFRRIALADAAGFDGWQRFATQLSSNDNAVVGAYHALDFMEEIGFENISDIELSLIRDVPGFGDVERVYDIVVGTQRFELKNVKEIGSKDIDQLIRDLRLLTDDELRELTWVFRGQEDPSIIKRIIDAVKDYDEAIYTDGIFDESNIIFFRNSRPF